MDCYVRHPQRRVIALSRETRPKVIAVSRVTHVCLPNGDTLTVILQSTFIRQIVGTEMSNKTALALIKLILLMSSLIRICTVYHSSIYYSTALFSSTFQI